MPEARGKVLSLSMQQRWMYKLSCQSRSVHQCIKHGAKTYKYKKHCRVEGCANFVVKGGLCLGHGAKVKRCNSDGGTNLAKQGGV